MSDKTEKKAPKKKEFTSNVTGDVWQKFSHKRWDKCINQIGIIIEDEVHMGKNNTQVVLEAGSKVIIDDIRGRILPQYRVRDTNGKIWFISATNVEFLYDQDRVIPEGSYTYRGGIRSTDEESLDIAERYERPSETTEDVMKEFKRNQREEKEKAKQKENK